MATTDLYVERSGQGHPAVVLVHAGIADLRMWDRQVATLAPRHRVVRYDVRGYGRSPDPAGDYYDHHDLLAVMDATGLDRAVLVGASNGGRIVLDTAVAAADRVAGIVLGGGAVPGIDLSDELQADFAGEDEALLAGDIDRARAINLRWWVDGVGRRPVDVGMRAAARHVAAHVPDGELVELDGTAHLPNIERPERFDELPLRFLAALS